MKFGFGDGRSADPRIRRPLIAEGLLASNRLTRRRVHQRHRGARNRTGLLVDDPAPDGCRLRAGRTCQRDRNPQPRERDRRSAAMPHFKPVAT